MSMDPLAFIYDRCASRGATARSQLDMRLTACRAYADRMRWVLAGPGWIDRGADALATQRPELAEVLAGIQTAAGPREVICLVHDWGRLANDDTHRLRLQERIVDAGGYTVTTFGESDRASARAVRVGRGA